MLTTFENVYAKTIMRLTSTVFVFFFLGKKTTHEGKKIDCLGKVFSRRMSVSFLNPNILSILDRLDPNDKFLFPGSPFYEFKEKLLWLLFQRGNFNCLPLFRPLNIVISFVPFSHYKYFIFSVRFSGMDPDVNGNNIFIINYEISLSCLTFRDIP